MWHRSGDHNTHKWGDAPSETEMDEYFEIADKTFVHCQYSNIDPAKIETKGAKLRLINENIKWIKKTGKKMKE